MDEDFPFFYCTNVTKKIRGNYSNGTNFEINYKNGTNFEINYKNGTNLIHRSFYL
jgi:hypothetical protein